MKKAIFWIFFLFGWQLAVSAQHRIQGEIYTADSLPLKDANIVLTSQDSVSRGTISDEGGRFVLKSVREGDNMLSISCVGCQLFSIRLSGIKEDIDLGKIVLLQKTTDLKEVTI